MQYDLKIGDNEVSVDATPLDEAGNTTITEGDSAREVLLTPVTGQRLRLVEAGRATDLFVARCADGIWVWSQGRARLVQDAAAQKSTRRGGAGGVGGDVTPPMPAVVLEILVEVGATVEKATRLVVVSAMKMETTLVAPHPGTVTAVNTEVGAKVAPGDILVEIEKANDDDNGDGDGNGEEGGSDE